MSSSGSVIDNDKLNSALIISVDGDLRQYPLPVTSSQILHMEALSPTAFFICDSDYLFYDDFISSIDFEEELESGQIYFLLPTEKLQYRLSASDMAALAVKASVALNNTSPNSASSSSKSSISTIDHDQSENGNNSNQQTISRRKNVNKARISPFVLMEANQINVVDHRHSSSSNSSSSTRYGSTDQAGKKRILSRSGSIRKLSRASSRRARLAVKSFRRLRLSTIYEEGNGLQLY